MTRSPVSSSVWILLVGFVVVPAATAFGEARPSRLTVEDRATLRHYAVDTWKAMEKRFHPLITTTAR